MILQRLAKPQNLQVTNDALVMKNAQIKGHFRAMVLEQGIQFLCGVYHLKDQLQYRKIPIPSEFFVLRIHEVRHKQNSNKVINAKTTSRGKEINFGVLLMSSSDEFLFTAEENSTIKTLEILLPRKYFIKQIKLDCFHDSLVKYLAVKTKDSLAVESSPIFKSLFHKVIIESNKQFSNTDKLEKLISLLLAEFFSAITTDVYRFMEAEKVKISKDEINRLINIRKHLDKDTPPPSLDSLTKIALMSSTSLKTKFKKMYGTTVFEYFQRRRMQKARILLLTHKYSVKQVGTQLGYTNLSNFSIAFKKEFNQLPRELIK